MVAGRKRLLLPVTSHCLTLLAMNQSFHFTGSIHDSPGPVTPVGPLSTESMLQWPGTRHGQQPISIHAGQGCISVRREGSFALLRGYIAGRGRTDSNSQQILLEQLLAQFIGQQDLALPELDGSFTLLLATTDNPRLLIFRNLVGNTFTYYQRTDQGLRFGSNLAELATSDSCKPGLNEQVLPLYFIYRFTPGQETLFRGINRLNPGEQLLYEKGQLQVNQVQTFADLVQPTLKSETDAIQCVEAVMSEITQDQMALYNNASGLLSGGVDSSYIQAHWNRAWQTSGQQAKPRSAAFWIDETSCLTDREYTLSAVDAFSTDHLSVQIENLVTPTIRRTLRDLGEMPNHVQSFYFPSLAKQMKQRGTSAGLCGEGADGLFGTDDMRFVIKANRIARNIPVRFLRHSAALAAQLLGKPYRAAWIRFADHLNDLDEWNHPINTNAAFTDWDDVASCFGRPAVQRALLDRQQLLVANRVPDDPLHLHHILSIGYLGEAVNTAAYWTAMFNSEGVDMLCPFLDTRMLRATINISTDVKFPLTGNKIILKKALGQHVPQKFVRRPKRGFGQPIFEWMSPGGPLRPAVEEIAHYDFLPDDLLKNVTNRPNWFLYNLLIFDIWHKEFFA